MYRIPIYKPSLTGREKEYVNECLESTWISSKGKYISLFEQNFANYINVKHADSVCNGTVAIHLALLALGIGPGDEVIVPTLTYVASVNSITHTGATPVFCDSLEGTWQMDPADVQRKITAKTKAIMAVHLYGHPCDMDALTSICSKHDLFLIEDCAESMGTLYKGQHVGTFGDISTFSFFGNKTITTGEGGMVVTNDKSLSERSKHIKGQGLAKNREYWHDIIGYNYRMTNIQAAIGVAQLEQADKFLKQKREIAGWYTKYLDSDKVTYHQETKNTYHSYWMFSILVNKPFLREPLREHLKSHSIETRPLFFPVHTMPMYATRYHKFEVAESLAARGINLPSHPMLTEAEVKEISQAINSFLPQVYASLRKAV
jgi:perosamine synthetase